MDELVLRAKNFATQAHGRINQLRKYTKQPYDAHLSSVAAIVAEVSDDPEMIAAAWLHDVVEDTPVTFDDLARQFGHGVTTLVEQLTDVSLPSDGNRARRMSINREHLAKATPRAQTIKLADLIDNATDISRHDPRFAATYLAEMAALLDILAEGDARLIMRARRVLTKCTEKLGLGRRSMTSEPGHAERGDFRRLAGRFPKGAAKFARAFCADDLSEPLSPDAGENSTELKTGQLLAHDAPLSDVIEVLTRHEVCVVSREGNVEGVIRRADIQKPIARMWLFGMVTVAELFFTKLIAELWPDDGWAPLVSPSRLKQAEALRAERMRRGQSCTLLDCLQIGDKGKILLRNPEQLAAFGFESRRAGDKVMTELGSLRNNLAHAQDIVSDDWAQIVRLARRLEMLVAGETNIGSE